MTNEPTENEETVPATSKKRQVAATVASTSVTILFGVAANVLISKVATQVHNRIAPKPADE